MDGDADADTDTDTDTDATAPVHANEHADADRDGTETRYYTSTLAPLRVVEAETGGVVTHEATGVDAECPYESFHDVYEVRIEYRPGAHAVEIASLRRYLDQFAGVEISHEALCETVFSDLRTVLDPARLAVTLRCNEYHGIVTTVERSTG
jgi:NADPH-dependent 7-cyano-7-deazaguanine reductase QueF